MEERENVLLNDVDLIYNHIEDINDDREYEKDIEIEKSVRIIEKQGEKYLNSFDFFQHLHRWLYQNGIFNHN